MLANSEFIIMLNQASTDRNTVLTAGIESGDVGSGFVTGLICAGVGLSLIHIFLPIGMLVVLDSILNRITQNRAKGINTFIFIDEIYLLFQHEYLSLIHI